MSYPDLTKFKALSFDCYGTLVDWESGLREGLQPIIARLPPTSSQQLNDISSHDPSAALTKRFDELSAALEVTEPHLRYDLNLARTFSTLASEVGVSVSAQEASAFGALPGTWAPFADTVAGLAVLQKHYKLILLSNIDEANIRRSVSLLAPVALDAVYTAEQIGSYKPADANFAYLFEHVREELGVEWDAAEGGLLHVARSLTADHVPAKRLGLRSVWISRGGDVKGGEGVGGDLEGLRGQVGFEWRFDTIGEFAKEVERQFGSLKG
ncbi:haloacid dehalogenase, type II [Colletotrichum orchidophilum]|uniref:Haloacid dehalogenase, type II n=1 Tax=Colletotrichum orchidophilum TaxID=1209926 RepID=A0A1G4AN74_9PEZI|nr:haloacid dehalogenase, type II [Colletotrichum orchidophilum]OHE90629.1 haloacid dehalogenase, type II [Colletotrichum orchidophilum]